MMTLTSKAIFSTVWIDMLKQRGAYVGDCLSVSRCSDFELKSANGICIGNSMICSDIWHKYHK